MEGWQERDREGGELESRSKEKCVKWMDRRRAVGDGASHRARGKEREREGESTRGRWGKGFMALLSYV